MVLFLCFLFYFPASFFCKWFLITKDRCPRDIDLILHLYFLPFLLFHFCLYFLLFICFLNNFLFIFYSFIFSLFVALKTFSCMPSIRKNCKCHPWLEFISLLSREGRLHVFTRHPTASVTPECNCMPTQPTATNIYFVKWAVGERGGVACVIPGLQLQESPST